MLLPPGIRAEQWPLSPSDGFPMQRCFTLHQFLGRNHLGGTMFPNQWTPKFTATYLEIEEHFGGFNFGVGNGQLDLAAMEFDWACG